MIDFDAVLRHPLFYSSPSPMSLLFHGLLIFWAARIVRQRILYKKHSWLYSFADAFFLVGFIVLSGDFIWMTICGLRFLFFYPDNLFLVVCVLGRDVAGMILCYMLQRINIGSIIQFKPITKFMYLVLIGFLTVNFAYAVDPTWTDWTYAIRQGKDTMYILTVFLVNWVGGKLITVGLVWSWFQGRR